MFSCGRLRYVSPSSPVKNRSLTYLSSPQEYVDSSVIVAVMLVQFVSSRLHSLGSLGSSSFAFPVPEGQRRRRSKERPCNYYVSTLCR